MVYILPCMGAQLKVAMVQLSYMMQSASEVMHIYTGAATPRYTVQS